MKKSYKIKRSKIYDYSGVVIGFLNLVRSPIMDEILKEEENKGPMYDIDKMQLKKLKPLKK